MLNLEIHADGDGVIRIAGELDLAVAQEFSAQALASVDGAREIVLDLAELTFLDSSGLRAILELSERCRGREIVLRHPRDNVRKLFHIAGLEGRSGIRIIEPEV